MEFYYVIDKLHLIPDYVLRSPSTLCIRPSYREDPCTYTRISMDDLDMFGPLVFDFLLFVNPDPELRTYLTLLGLEVTLETNSEYISVFNNVLLFGHAIIHVNEF